MLAELPSLSLIVALILLAAGCHAPEIPPDSRFRVTHGIPVQGNRSFHAALTWALDDLREHSPDAYQRFMALPVASITWSESNSGVWFADAIDVRLTSRSTYFSRTWLPGVLVHEGCHIAQYLAGEVYTGIIAEPPCLAQQRKVAVDVGAPAAEIDYLGRQDGSHANVAPAQQDW